MSLTIKIGINSRSSPKIKGNKPVVVRIRSEGAAYMIGYKKCGATSLPKS